MIFDEKKFGCELIFFSFGFVYYFPSLTKKNQFHDTSDLIEQSLTNKMKLPMISGEDKGTHNITKDL